jgi:hypothetical protein
MAAVVSVPILLKFRKEMGSFLWAVGVFLIVASLIIQLASLAFWLPLEIYQADDFGHPQFTMWLRFKNIIAFAFGKMEAWSLNTDSMTYDQWDYQHITTWNFMPFVLRRVGDAPRWAVDLALGGWYAGIAALFATVMKLKRVLRTTSRTF